MEEREIFWTEGLLNNESVKTFSYETPKLLFLFGLRIACYSFSALFACLPDSLGFGGHEKTKQKVEHSNKG